MVKGNLAEGTTFPDSISANARPPACPGYSKCTTAFTRSIHGLILTPPPACGNYDETRKERKVYYNEGIFVGYRGYDRKQVEPLYPFGYGLSYTSFEYSDLQLTEIDKKNKSVALSFNITNTGGYEGAEVAQVYVRDIASKEARPLKELKGFQKVFLRPGETKHVSVTLDRDAFQYFSEKKSDWVFESGEFEIWVGASSKDIRLKTKVKM